MSESIAWMVLSVGWVVTVIWLGVVLEDRRQMRRTLSEIRQAEWRVEFTGKPVTDADMRSYEQAMSSTRLCEQCGGLGRVEREA